MNNEYYSAGAKNPVENPIVQLTLSDCGRYRPLIQKCGKNNRQAGQPPSVVSVKLANAGLHKVHCANNSAWKTSRSRRRMIGFLDIKVKVTSTAAITPPGLT
jgi:hypothetical protein